jgi:hypothetical protein
MNNKVLLKRNYMLRMLVLAFVLLALLIVSLQAVSADFSNGPTNPGGGIVTRFEEPFGYHIPDYDAGISAFIGGDPVKDCMGEDPGFELVSIQDALVDDDANRIVSVLHGDDLTVTVWPFPDFDCELLLTVEPIAVGTVDLRLTDNDVFVYENPNHKHVNAFGVMANGTVYDGDGKKMKLNAHDRIVWDGYDFGTAKIVSKVFLR